jgi:putative hydrolase of the HAD superfamily
MLDSIRFSAYPDVAPALEELRARGLRLVVASNWDCSLPQVLADAGLLPLVDGVVASAVVGADKPAAAVFEAALRLAGSDASRAVHVGDSPAKDVEGARRAGIRAVLIDRETGQGEIASLAELPRIL